MMRLLLISAAMLIAASPAPPQRNRDKVPEATPAGEAVSCISISQVRETHVRSDKVIDFVAAGGKVYRNELPYSCPGLGSEQRFIHKTSLNEYCAIDTITVLYNAPIYEGASCGLGKFQPVTLTKK
jgi:hypothetical protein